MTSQPTHTPPFWQVQSVFDPDGTGRDFAYTIGLHTRGLPELHLWARPSLGEDPGEDWMLSPRDRCGILNELADLLLAGQLGVGSELTREYDAGHARVSYRVDPPGDKEQLEALGVPEGVDVLPVLWSLERAPEGPCRPLSATAGREAEVRYEEIVAGLDRGLEAPPGWALPATPDFDVEQRFGPLTPVVLARAAQLWQADDETLVELLHSAGTAVMGGVLGSAATVASAIARPVGRRHALRRVDEGVHELVDRLTAGSAAHRRRWRAVVRTFDPAWWAELDRAGLAGLRHEQVPTLPEWQAGPEVQVAVEALLGRLDLQTLYAIAELHATAMRCSHEVRPGYQELCGRLQGWALVSAAACPWEPVLASLPGWRPLLAGLPGATLGSCPELHHWATCLTSALTHRAWLSAEDVRTFCYLHREILPGLVDLLNNPL
jgi:hypothetical protein